MPIKEEDPWRLQYFLNANCPDDLIIPTEDCDAYSLYPDHRWVYNKMLVCETQGILCAPHGMPPPHYPIFSKPIYNMRGMGAGSMAIRSKEEYMAEQKPGHFWCEILTGPHVSTDIAVVGGEPAWMRHAIGEPGAEGTFSAWTIVSTQRDLDDPVNEWVTSNLAGYTGMVNVETIGGKIIECHLRFADQWPDLYGEGWVDALVELYANKRWDFSAAPATGHSVVLFGPHGRRYQGPPQDLIDDILSHRDITSVQITFHEDRPPEQHSMPPGGFRLAIVNGWDRSSCDSALERLKASFDSNI